MRRGFASLILTLALLVASASWSGFVLTRTVFDEGRSEALAEQLLDNEEVRSVLATRLVNTLKASLPPEAALAQPKLEEAADTALDDPRVQELFKEQLVVAHQNALRGVDEPLTVDTSVLGQVGREVLIEQQPQVASLLPETPSLEVTLPTTGFSWVGKVNNIVRKVTYFGALIAIAGVLAALSMTTRREKVLRRVAYWAFGAAAFWIIVAIAAPRVLGFVAPSSMVVAAAAVDVFFGAMIKPAILMAFFGLGVLGLSLLWPRFSKSRAAGQVELAGGGSAVGRRRYQSGANPQRPSHSQYPEQGYRSENPTSSPGAAAPRREAPRGFDSGVDQTQVMRPGQPRSEETWSAESATSVWSAEP